MDYKKMKKINLFFDNRYENDGLHLEVTTDCCLIEIFIPDNVFLLVKETLNQGIRPTKVHSECSNIFGGNMNLFYNYIKEMYINKSFHSIIAIIMDKNFKKICK